MNQTKLGSLIESLFNIFIGYFVALSSQLLIFPMFDINITLMTNIWIGVWFTVISITRSYIIRRWFNARLHKLSTKMAEDLKND